MFLKFYIVQKIVDKNFRNLKAFKQEADDDLGVYVLINLPEVTTMLSLVAIHLTKVEIEFFPSIGHVIKGSCDLKGRKFLWLSHHLS